jgi:tetraacyldisaccharide 4'-kinase
MPVQAPLQVPVQVPPASLRARLAARLQRSWVKRDWLAFALLDVSWAYRGLVALRRFLYARGIFKSYRVPVPVIVVGNVVAGGAGKTPVVIEIVRYLQAQGWQPGVASRGYGRSIARGNHWVAVQVLENTAVSASGDEPALIRQATGAPVCVATRRRDAARALLAAHPSVNAIVCDDGLQHLALQRDIEVCVMDDRGVGNGWLLPAGPLREPWPRAVDFVLQTKLTEQDRAGAPSAPQLSMSGHADHPVDQENGSSSLTRATSFQIQRRLAPFALRADGTKVPLADLADHRLVAVAGIAQPEVFFAMLRAQGLTLQETISLPDHYNFSSWSRNDLLGCTLICTQKDAAKVWPTHPQALAVPLVVDIPASFFTALLKKLSSLPGHS